MCTSTWSPGKPVTDRPWPGLSPHSRVTSGGHILTFSPVRVTMSRGPYMNRPVTTCGPSSLATASLIRWLAATFWRRGGKGNGGVCEERNGERQVFWAHLVPL